MLRDAVGGARLGFRHWPSMLSLGLLIAIASTVLALLLSDVITQLSVLRGGQEMRERLATIFTPYYETEDVVDVSDPTLAHLADAIEEGSGYTAVVNNVQVNDPDFADGIPVILIFGDTVAEIVPSMQVCAPAPCMMRGADVSDESPRELQIGSITVAGGDHMQPASAFFDANMGAVPLDNRIVVMLPTEAFSFLDAYEREEAASRAVFLGDSSTDIDKYVASSANDGLFLVPHDVAVDQPARMAALMTMSAMYAVGLAAFLGVVIFAYTSVADRTLQKEQGALHIRRAHGATPVAISARLAGFVALALLVIPLPPLILLQVLPDPMALAAKWIIGLLLLLSIAMWAYFSRQQRRAEVRNA